jgi:hypothetical protein
MLKEFQGIRIVTPRLSWIFSVAKATGKILFGRAQDGHAEGIPSAVASGPRPAFAPLHDSAAVREILRYI